MRPATYRTRRLVRTVVRNWRLLAIGAVLLLLEVVFHVRSFAIVRPATNLDPPFHIGCQEPILNTSSRANAALIMLARNSDVDGAVDSIRSVQEQFNQHFGYPWVFLNDKEWSREFKTKVSKAISDGGGASDITFETIPPGMWGYPNWIDQNEARKSMASMERRKISYAGKESYHHMCRFNSGFFFDHPALLNYKWYWRVEPDIEFTCAVTYDPFVEMERNDKRYGYTIALWELGKTVPSLFRKLADYKMRRRIPTTSLWTAMMDPSYLPWPIRRLIWWVRNRDPYGDLWNMCHFWSNFEIADMEFFRSAEYRDFFRFLDEDGGFYYERWGDAPVHSLAAALLLRPDQVHHFADFGYVHKPFQYCTHAPTDDEIRRGELVPDLHGRDVSAWPERELGCNCHCDPSIEMVAPACFNRIRSTVM